MKYITLSLVAFICTTIFAIAESQIQLASKCYIVNPITGGPIIPLQEVQPGYTCLAFDEWCEICYQLDPQGNPIVGTEQRWHGRYNAP
jgi:hypothetical protein